MEIGRFFSMDEAPGHNPAPPQKKEFAQSLANQRNRYARRA